MISCIKTYANESVENLDKHRDKLVAAVAFAERRIFVLSSALFDEIRQNPLFEISELD